MSEIILAGNPEVGRLEAEVRMSDTISSDRSRGQTRDGILKKIAPTYSHIMLRNIKDESGTRPNRKGNDAPSGMSVCEHSLWLLAKNEIPN